MNVENVNQMVVAIRGADGSRLTTERASARAVWRVVQDYYQPKFDAAVDQIRHYNADKAIRINMRFVSASFGLVDFVHAVGVFWTYLVAAYQSWKGKGASVVATWVGAIRGHLINIRDKVIPTIVEPRSKFEDKTEALEELLANIREFQPTILNVFNQATRWNVEGLWVLYFEVERLATDCRYQAVVESVACANRF